MPSFRTLIPDFQLANPAYVGATIFVYEVDENGAKTNTLATLYAGARGNETVRNPQVLDAEGKFERPVYFEVPIVMDAITSTVGSHSTGVLKPMGGEYRGEWTPNTVYLPGDLVAEEGTEDSNIYVANRMFTSRSALAADVIAGDLDMKLRIKGVNLARNQAQAAANAAQQIKDEIQLAAILIEGGPVSTVNGQTGTVTLTASDIPASGGITVQEKLDQERVDEYEEFLVSGVWHKQPGARWVFVEGVGGGGGGSNHPGTTHVGGGGGGAFNFAMFRASELPDEVPVGIGDGGQGGATGGFNAGIAGGDTTFGTFLICKGGKPSGGYSGGEGGGGELGAINGTGGGRGQTGFSSGGGAWNTLAPGNSQKGGAGGGANYGGGTSLEGGNGGTGNLTANAKAGDGAFPGGGGGGSGNNGGGGNGGRGRLRVWCMS